MGETNAGIDLIRQTDWTSEMKEAGIIAIKYADVYSDFWSAVSAKADTGAAMEHAIPQEEGLSKGMASPYLAARSTVSLLYSFFGSCKFDTRPDSDLIGSPASGLYDSGFWCKRFSTVSTPSVNWRYFL